MVKTYNYNQQSAKEKYNLITDDMLYNIIINLRENNLSFDYLAEELGITIEELLDCLINQKKDFFLELESISILETKGIYKNYSRLKK